MFTLNIKTDNDAFGDGQDTRNEECARILERVAKKLRDLIDSGACRDINGNTVGLFGFGGCTCHPIAVEGKGVYHHANCPRGNRTL